MNTKLPTVSVVIPNFNGREIMEKNLPSLFSAVENKDNNIIEVIIVDDGSTDESVFFLQKFYVSEYSCLF